MKTRTYIGLSQRQLSYEWTTEAPETLSLVRAINVGQSILTEAR